MSYEKTGLSIKFRTSAKYDNETPKLQEDFQKMLSDYGELVTFASMRIGDGNKRLNKYTEHEYFVEFKKSSQAKEASAELDGSEFDGWKLTCMEMDITVFGAPEPKQFKYV